MARGLCSGAMVPVHVAEAEAGPWDLVGNLALVGGMERVLLSVMSYNC